MICVSMEHVVLMCVMSAGYVNVEQVCMGSGVMCVSD